MKKLIKNVIKEFNCSKKNAITIINNAINNSNIAQMTIKNMGKKEYSI